MIADEAQRLKNEDASRKLQSVLQKGSDFVPCPECGAVTKEMLKVKHRDLLDGCVGIGIGLVGILLCALLVYYCVKGTIWGFTSNGPGVVLARFLFVPALAGAVGIIVCITLLFTSAAGAAVSVFGLLRLFFGVRRWKRARR